MLKRVVLFLLTNLAVLVLLSVAFALLRATGLLGKIDTTYLPLAIFATVYGFAGSVISLFLSKFIAKWATGAKVITVPRSEHEQWLLHTVARLSQQAAIGLPEVAIYDSPEMNAFATGPSKQSSLVAVSSGLLRAMSRDEIEAVLAHEISHVSNGDMVTLTLIQGVVNTFVIFFSRVIGNVVDKAVFKTERGRGLGYWVTVVIAQIVLGILAMIIVMWFSRWREYRADAGSAQLVGAPKMIAALQRLSRGEESGLPDSVAAFGIRGGGGLFSLFRSHPPIEARIARLAGARSR